MNETTRSKTYNENNAAFEAVAKTTDNVISFVAENTATKIKISEIKGSGKKAEMIIEAGANIGLEKGERSNVIKVSTITINGSVQQRKEKLGEIEIKEFIEDIASSCTFEDGRDTIMDAFKEIPNEIMVVTKLKAIPAK